MYSKLFKLTLISGMVLLMTVGVAFAEDTLAQDGDDPVTEIADIQEKIDNAQDNDEIEVDSDYLFSVTINKNITLKGNGSQVFQGDFKSTSDNLVVKNINFTYFNSFELKGNSIFDTCTFKNAYTNIKAEGRAVFINCNFINMNAEFGGAVAATGDATFIGCNFTGNQGLHGGVIDSVGSLTITNSSFVGNNAFYNVGVIISHQKNEQLSDICYPDSVVNYGSKVGTVRISNSTFENNSAGDSIGVIFSSNKLIIDNSTFRNNSATFMGVIMSSNDLTVRNSRFMKNRALLIDPSFPSQGLISVINSVYGKTVISGSEFVGNVANYCAISLSFTNVDMSGNVFSNNRQGTIFVGDCTSKYPKYTILDDNLKAVKLFKLTSSNVVASYGEGKPIVVKLTNPTTSKGISNIIIEAEYKRSHTTSYTGGVTDKNGKASISPPIDAKLNTKTITLYLYSATFWEGFATTTIKYTLTKIPTKVSAPKVTFKHKKSKYFKVTVKDKVDKKPAKGIKIKVKVYTGKKSKTYTLKTNGKGLAKLNTKKLKVGKHKVKISSASKIYSVSATSQIKIKR